MKKKFIFYKLAALILMLSSCSYPAFVEGPENVQLSKVSGEYILTWNPVAGATSYRIYYTYDKSYATLQGEETKCGYKLSYYYSHCEYFVTAVVGGRESFASKHVSM